LQPIHAWVGISTIALLGSLACARSPGHLPAPPIPGEARGWVIKGFENFAFVPCDSVPHGFHLWDSPLTPTGFNGWAPYFAAKEVWPDSLPESRNIRLGPYDHDVWYVRWVGQLQGPGSFGHLGLWDYKFVVRTIIEMRYPEPDDCPEPAA
jgi:hypothetical protein